MSRVLIFSPYALWGIHTIYESTIARACAARGAEIQYLLCDGLLPECDQHWDSKDSTGRPADLCQRCQAAASASSDRQDFPYAWLGSLVDASERISAMAWVQALAPGDFRSANFRGLSLGEWVVSSVVSYFRKYPPDLEDAKVTAVYRGFLYSAAIVGSALTRYLDGDPVDAALLFNGRQSITRVAFEVFRQRGIRVLTHERAEYERGHINVRPNAHCMSPEPFKDFWQHRAQVSLSQDELDTTLQWLIRRRYGANLAWIPFNTPSHQRASIRKKLGLTPNGRLWALFTSSMDEVAADPVMQGPYESQIAWVDDVIDWVKSRPDVQLIIKVHPNLGGNRYIGKAANELQAYEGMRLQLPPNVRIVTPEQQLSAYELAEEADIGLTFGSIMGLEMAMLGKPVVLASRAFYENGAHFLTVCCKKDLVPILERCAQATADRGIQREAYRLAYAYIFKFEMPFRALSVSDIYAAQPNYTTVNDLASGKDASLDCICDFLMHGKNLHRLPAPEEVARDTADENVFFRKLTSSGDYLRNARYERWLRLRSVGRSVRSVLLSLPFGVGQLALNLGRGRWHSLLVRMERKA